MVCVTPVVRTTYYIAVYNNLCLINKTTSQDTLTYTNDLIPARLLTVDVKPMDIIISQSYELSQLCESVLECLAFAGVHSLSRHTKRTQYTIIGVRRNTVYVSWELELCETFSELHVSK